ncbi:hypothetical protein [Paeniglutamicibacter terrestris]|uniref:Tetratricopeptide repeat protein n=1 Tax=Paeniglutamicibacter terrestris TaxID=2723403 RepID=A0ABX1G477_9MICC|nr:hypothetical protein [Paeniglutamicibacter terrestris]NKG21051.1 hypothetical protein [Paeniglutamicibacter terrestris]
MSRVQGNPCTISTYCHHAFAAMLYGRWAEAEALLAKAAALIEKEVAS